MQCHFMKSNNQPCQAHSIDESKYCYFHNPESGEDRKESQARGGKANAITMDNPLPPMLIKEASNVVILLQDTINHVRAGEMDVKIGNCIGVLSGHLLKALEVANIENRVEIIERAILEKKTIIH